MNYHVWQFGYWNKDNVGTLQNRYMNCFSKRSIINYCNLAMSSPSNAGSITISLSESDIYRVNSSSHYVLQSSLPSLTNCMFGIGDKTGATSGRSDAMYVCDCTLPEPSIIWLPAGREVSYGIGDFPRMIERLWICSESCLGAGAATTRSICGITSAGTRNLVILDVISLSWKYWAVSINPGCVN
jgi:hypothetical protein